MKSESEKNNHLLRIALVGNPNSGKTTLFNALTGLNQKTGNFPGVTVEKKTGFLSGKASDKNYKIELLDLPGVYSLFPKSLDEEVTSKHLFASEPLPDATVVVIDASNLKRHLLLATQVISLGLPTLIVLNMMDVAEKNNIQINVDLLSEKLGVKVLSANSRNGDGIAAIKNALPVLEPARHAFYPIKAVLSDEQSSLLGIDTAAVSFLDVFRVNFHKGKLPDFEHVLKGFEERDLLFRYERIRKIAAETVSTGTDSSLLKKTKQADKILTHPFFGFTIFIAVLFIIFQTIFYLADFPMTWIEQAFVAAGEFFNNILPDTVFRNFLVNGLLSGLSGILVFVPQVALLFGFIAILEDSGYMARISFLSDRMMKVCGLNGRSVIPLMSGMACAVPAIMGTRTISNVKERLITIMVTPLMSCSARLPVYTLLISLMVPEQENWGPFNLRGIIMTLLYCSGALFAFFAAIVMKLLIKSRERSFFIMEMPVYRWPQWKTVGITMYEKAKVFVRDAGKIILILALIIWYLSNFGPTSRMEAIDKKYGAATNTELSGNYATERLENSYAGILGKKIEPLIRPLGFDWKIGISLITSFAAREVFVSTMATIYNAGQDNLLSTQQRMKEEKNNKGEVVYSTAVCASLLIFYLFAMQCISTLAIVRRETGSWKWPAIQFFYMTGLAYLASFVVYQLLK